MRLPSSSLSSVVIICLGQKLYNNQTLPISLLSRIDKVIDTIDKSAIYMTDKNETISIIFSGSDTASCGITEAEAMHISYIEMIKSYPTIQDITTNIILEQKSRNTIENAIYCKDITTSNCYKKILLVTNEFHMPRARLLFEYVYQNINTSIEIICIPANSKHVTNNSTLYHTINCDSNRTHINNGYYRLMDDRPKDVNEWTLYERLDWEYNALQNIHQQLINYSIPVKSDDLAARIHQAIKELQTMNYSSNNPII